MVAEEKQAVIDAWDRHVEGIARRQKLLRFSSVAEAAFQETFKKGILADNNLTDKEKLEVCAYIERSKRPISVMPGE